MKPAIATAIACLAFALCAPVVQAEDATAAAPPPDPFPGVIDVHPYCDPKHPNPNDPIQATYCGGWSGIYVLTYFIENATITQPVRETLKEGVAAAKTAVDCIGNWQDPSCPHLLGDE